MENKLLDFTLDYYKTLCSNNILWPVEVIILEDFCSHSMNFITKIEYNDSKFEHSFKVGMVFFCMNLISLEEEINKGFEEVKEGFKLFRNKIDEGD